MARQNSAQAIERAAVRLFATRGFVGTSVRDLAAEVGVSAANIYNHNTSKEELLWNIINRTMNDLLTIAVRAETISTCPVAQVEMFVLEHVEYHALHRGEARIGNTQWRHLSDERVQIVHDQRDRYTNTLVGIVSAGGEKGFFLQPERKMVSFSLIASGLGVSQWYRGTGDLSAQQIAGIYCGFAHQVLELDKEFHDAQCPDPGHSLVVKRTTIQERTGRR